jgi:hypothetical protein
MYRSLFGNDGLTLEEVEERFSRRLMLPWGSPLRPACRMVRATKLMLPATEPR